MQVNTKQKDDQDRLLWHPAAYSSADYKKENYPGQDIPLSWISGLDYRTCAQ